VLSHQVNWYFWAATATVRQLVRHTATLHKTTSTVSVIVDRISYYIDCKIFIFRAVSIFMSFPHQRKWDYLLTHLLTSLLTYFLLIPCSTVLLEKLTGSSVSQDIPRILWSLKVCHCVTMCPPPVPILSQINPFDAPHPTSWRSMLMLTSHLILGLSSGLFPSGFLTKTLYTPLLSPCVLHAPPISFFLILSPEQYWKQSLITSSKRGLVGSKNDLYFVKVCFFL
jgi:hypothetical protein